MAKVTRVLDASGVIRSDLDYRRGGFGIPASVLSELKGERQRTAVEAAVRDGLVCVLNPAQESLSKAREAAQETGDLHSLSAADLDVLACALDHGAALVSDDYAVQNAAAKLGLLVEATVHDPIRRLITWVWACPGCSRRMDGPGVCPVCGHEGRRARASSDVTAAGPPR